MIFEISPGMNYIISVESTIPHEFLQLTSDVLHKKFPSNTFVLMPGIKSIPHETEESLDKLITNLEGKDDETL